MKKTLVTIALCCLLAAGFSGCAKKEAAQAAFTADNEIFTYERIDEKKTQLVVSRTGNISLAALLEAFEEKNPDVHIVYVDITGGTSQCKPLIDWVEKGYAPDVVISAAGFFDGEMTKKYFENLSTNPILQNYESAALKRTATDSDVYWLPGPSNVTAMLYNKTLFDKYGWEVPKTFDEFVALCKKIREDTNGEVDAWNPNAKYENELKTAIEAMVYEEVFAGVENRSWYNAFTAGKESFQGHMEPYYNALKTLADNGILREEHFSYSATARGKEFAAGKIAMINMSIYDADNEQFDFGYMPFPTTKGELGYISDKYSCFVGIPKKERSEKLTDAINRFIAFFSTAEGQQIYIGKSLMVSNIKDVPLNQTDDLAALQPVIEAGHLFAMLEFISDDGVSCNYGLYEPAKAIVLDQKTVKDCIADTLQKEAYSRSETAKVIQPVAKAEKDMTILETSFYIADAYREAADTQIALIANNEVYRGNLMRIFKGDISPAMVTVLKPRSFANDSQLMRTTMLGQQLLDALSHPVGHEGVANCIYAYSGLKCEIAPWNEQSAKYLTVTLADGQAIDPEKEYTVAYWGGTIDEEYLTNAQEAVEGSFEDVLTAKMTRDGKVAPFSDSRVKLIWK